MKTIDAFIPSVCIGSGHFIIILTVLFLPFQNCQLKHFYIHKLSKITTVNIFFEGCNNFLIAIVYNDELRLISTIEDNHWLWETEL